MRLQRLAFVAMEKESVGSSNVAICSNIDSPFCSYLWIQRLKLDYKSVIQG
ncbi:hypothetical protein Hanom_Chr04g00296631 [Helianthus anomalus]